MYHVTVTLTMTVNESDRDRVDDRVFDTLNTIRPAKFTDNIDYDWEMYEIIQEPEDDYKYRLENELLRESFD